MYSSIGPGMVEALETRRLFSVFTDVNPPNAKFILPLTGTNSDDQFRIAINSEHTGVVVSINDRHRVYALGTIIRISINARKGNDSIVADESNGKIFGEFFVDAGPGNDTVRTGSGPDEILGGDGKDFIDAGGGTDDVNGGTDNDTIYGGAGNDMLHGYEGRDKLYGGDGNELIGSEIRDDTNYRGHGIDKPVGQTKSPSQIIGKKCEGFKAHHTDHTFQFR